MRPDPFPIDGLKRLESEQGLDVRSTVLRVATDLFCQTATHSPAEITRYVGLAHALLDVADGTTRLAVAQKLAQADHAPESLLRRLRDDTDVMVASAILAGTQMMPVHDVPAFVSSCGPAAAAAIARRQALDQRSIRTLAAYRHPLVAEALLENLELAFDTDSLSSLISQADDKAELAELLFARTDIPAAAYASLYPKAPADVRRRIRASLAETPGRTSPPVNAEVRNLLDRIIRSRDRQAIARALAAILNLNPDRMRLVLDDPTGEIFALALSAAGYKRSDAINILLVLAPIAVRTSVTKIFAAADAHDEMPVRAARDLVMILAGNRHAEPAVHEPHMHNSSAPLRLVGGARRQITSQRIPLRRTGEATS